jgi:hypothetical protein
VADTSHTPGCLINFDVFEAFIFNFKVLHLIVIAGTGAEKTSLSSPFSVNIVTHLEAKPVWL